MAHPPDEKGARCLLCGSGAEPLYEGMRDRVYGTPGEWRMVRCPNPACGLVFLAPPPTGDELARAYAGYYTREVDPKSIETPARRGRLRSGAHRLHLGVLRGLGAEAKKRRIELSYLDRVSPGRVLDVGCGSGSRLAELRRLGWEVVGQEIDEKAAEIARTTHRLDVRIGPLASLRLRDSQFDAVVMHHVIEHVSAPTELLAECWRLVKPTGHLVCVTPNVEGLGHWLFRHRWRGLEPPRHQVLFCIRTLGVVATRAGIDRCRVWTSAANSLTVALPRRRQGGTLAGFLTTSCLVALHVFEIGLHAILPSSGDECILWATK
ncbi:MAG: class I SAM-dependent methyltransferase [Thermoanaerobaculales bacterium]